ncbi:hypothetical protein D9M69_643440 [compost metagenome]
MRARLPGAAADGAQRVGLARIADGFHFIGRHFGVRRVTQVAVMDIAEVRHVEEVLHQPWRRGGNVVGAADHAAAFGVVVLGEGRQFGHGLGAVAAKAYP